MTGLSVFLLGQMRVLLDEQPLAGFDSDKVRGLLAYLACEPASPHRRSALAGLFWPDFAEEAARANLCQALANLRKITAAAGRSSACLEVDRQTVTFVESAALWVDVNEFSDLLEKDAPGDTPPADLERASSLYQGSFLADFYLPGCAAFEEWALVRRERLHRQAVAALHRLASHYEAGHDEQNALRCAWRLRELDPWSEDSLRCIMRLLASSGQCAAALAQYELTCAFLVRELVVEPSPETRQLYQQIYSEGQAAGDSLQPYRALALSRETGLEAQPAPALARSWMGAVRPAPSRSRLSSLLAQAFLGLALLALGVLIGVWIGQARPEGLPASFVNSAALGGSLPPLPEAEQGQRVVLVCEGVEPAQICVRDRFTGKLTRLPGFSFAQISYPNWSPDGQSILFSASEEYGSEAEYWLCQTRLDGKGLSRTGELVGRWGVWSPDGEWIALQRSLELWLARYDGSQETHLAPRQGWEASLLYAWAPSSARLAYIRASSRGYGEVWVVERAGGEPQLLKTVDCCSRFFDLAWSPDGASLLLYCEAQGKEVHLLMQADGQGELELAQAGEKWYSNFYPKTE